MPLGVLPLRSLFQRRFYIPTPLECSSWVCGLCGLTVEELASPLHPPLDGPVVIHTDVLEADGVTLEQMEGPTQIGSTWTLADGRVYGYRCKKCAQKMSKKELHHRRPGGKAHGRVARRTPREDNT